MVKLWKTRGAEFCLVPPCKKKLAVGQISDSARPPQEKISRERSNHAAFVSNHMRQLLLLALALVAGHGAARPRLQIEPTDSDKLDEMRSMTPGLLSAQNVMDDYFRT